MRDPIRRWLYAALGVALLSGAAIAADNFVTGDATGAFKVISCTDTSGVCTLNVASSASSAAAAGITPVASSALGTGLVLKASPGNLYSVTVVVGATPGRVLVHNSTTVPAAGAVTPLECFTVAANSTATMNYAVPIRFSTGISVSFTSSTTTCFTQTDSATAFISGRIS